VIERLYPKGEPKPVPGLREPLGGPKKSFVEAGGRTLEAPFNWDFALLRERGVLPGVGRKSLEVPRVSGITLDGRLDEAAWQKAASQEMSEIGMGALKNATQFKVAYDEKYLYVAFVCHFDDAASLEKLKSLGRDGTAYWQENVEIMLDPIGQRDRHCHFILNPVPNSTFDRRLGYIEDPLHPLYGKPDAAWNGAWDYAAVIDRENKRWTVEVRLPFAGLEVPPPQPGTVWTMNLGRTEFVGGRKEAPIYSIWSPNLEARDFHDRSTFGDVVFR